MTDECIDDETNEYIDNDDDIEFKTLSNSEKEKHRLEIRRRIEDKLEERRLRQEAYDDFLSY